MTTRDPFALHADHKVWQGDIQMWRQDIDEWETEQAKFVADLEAALRIEVTKMKEHARAIGRHEEHVLQHEHLLAELQRSERPRATEIEARMADVHEKESLVHDRLWQLHEQLKRSHHRSMGKLAVVPKALADET